MPRAPRRDQRDEIEGINRVLLIENDLDAHDDRIDAIEDRLEKGFREQNERIGRMTWALVAAVVSTSTASILFALNLVAGT